MTRSFHSQEPSKPAHCNQVCHLLSDVDYSNVFFYIFTTCVLFVVGGSFPDQLHKQRRNELGSMGNIREQCIDQTTCRANQIRWTDHCGRIYARITAESQLCARIVPVLFLFFLMECVKRVWLSSFVFQGYYTRHEVFGRKGDFITAPEISQIFGEVSDRVSSLVSFVLMLSD